MTKLACATCKYRKKNGGVHKRHYGVDDLDICRVSGMYLDTHHKKVTSPDECTDYVERLSLTFFCERMKRKFSSKSIETACEKSDPRNIAAEMIALDIIKNKIYPTIKKMDSNSAYTSRYEKTFENKGKFSFVVEKKVFEQTKKTSYAIQSVDFAKRNGFELTKYGENIIVEAVKKLETLKKEEDKAKAEHDAKQAAIDFIEKRLGIHKLEATGKINISRFKDMSLSKLEIIWSDPDVSLIYENEELEFIENRINELKVLKTPVSSTTL